MATKVARDRKGELSHELPFSAAQRPLRSRRNTDALQKRGAMRSVGPPKRVLNYAGRATRFPT